MKNLAEIAESDVAVLISCNHWIVTRTLSFHFRPYLHFGTNVHKDSLQAQKVPGEWCFQW